MTTAADLIKRSYYLAQILDPNEEIEGFQAAEGLEVLNDIIQQWGSLAVYIPTYKIITVTTEAGTASYTITPCITKLNEAHLIDQNDVLYKLDIIDLARFNTLNFELVSNTNRPFLIFVQNDFVNYPTQSKIVFYQIPDNTYTVTLYAMVRLESVAYSDDLSTIPEYYQRPLRYEMARELSEIYGTILPANFEDKYNELMKQLKGANQKDKRVKVSNQFQTNRLYRPWGTYVD